MIEYLQKKSFDFFGKTLMKKCFFSGRFTKVWVPRPLYTLVFFCKTSALPD